MDQQLAGLAHEPLFQVFLDIDKAYDSLDKERFLEVLSGCVCYGLRTPMACPNYEAVRILTRVPT